MAKEVTGTLKLIIEADRQNLLVFTWTTWYTNYGLLQEVER